MPTPVVRKQDIAIARERIRAALGTLEDDPSDTELRAAIALLEGAGDSLRHAHSPFLPPSVTLGGRRGPRPHVA